MLCHIIDVASVYFFKYRKRQSFFSIGSKDWYLLQLFYDPSRELSSKTFLVVVVESPPFLNLNNYYCFLQFLHDNGEIRFLNYNLKQFSLCRYMLYLDISSKGTTKIDTFVIKEEPRAFGHMIVNYPALK